MIKSVLVIAERKRGLLAVTVLLTTEKEDDF